MSLRRQIALALKRPRPTEEVTAEVLGVIHAGLNEVGPPEQPSTLLGWPTLEQMPDADLRRALLVAVVAAVSYRMRLAEEVTARTGSNGATG